MFSDFHNHALPGIDDGAATLDESIEMIHSLYAQDVRRIILTPHFSKDQNLALFLAERKKAFLSLKNSVPSKMRIQLAAEVSLEERISREVELSKLTIDKTRYIMLRLPYFAFEEWIDFELHNILYKHRLIPVFTSIDRYRHTYPKEKYNKILSTPDAVFQFNIKSFYDKENVKVLKRLISANKTVLLGSNAHNMNTRKPNFDILKNVLENDLGKLIYNYLIIQNNHFSDRFRKG